MKNNNSHETGKESQAKKNRRAFRKSPYAIIASLLAAMLFFSGGTLVGCTTPVSEEEATETTEAEVLESVDVRVASLKGPTSIGLVNFMAVAEESPANLGNSYDFSIYGSADELAPLLMSGGVDIALLPSNLAATLYNRTEGEIITLAVNTLGVLYVVSGDDTVTDMSSLAGRTVLMTGKGTTPEYVMSYLLEQGGLTGEVTLEYKSEATEVAAALAQDPAAIGILPEPYATAIASKDLSIDYRISLTEVWNEVVEERGEAHQLITGVTVVRKEFAEAHPEVVQEFIEQQALSINTALANLTGTAELIVEYGIVDDAQVAEKAIPRCNLVMITDDDMRRALEGYLGVLYSYDPESLGGSLPGDDFYYMQVTD